MKQTTLDLNGPILSFTTNPENVLVNNAGIATFVGIATATFPTQIPANSATSTGSISYQWYDSNVGRLSNSTYVTGTATSTLTLSNLISPTDHKRQVYVIADYVPSAYQSSSPITAGTARSTGNAINQSINSRTAIVSVRPQISIATQPIGSSAVENTNATINVVASSTDPSQGTFLYQWSLNGVNLTDDSTVSGSTTPNLTISRPIGTYTLQVKISNLFASNTPIFSDNVNIEFIPLRKRINIEQYDTTSPTAVLSSQNLLDEEITLLGQNQTSSTSLISLYAPEENINVEIDIYSGSGIGGAQGGYSRIRFLMKKNEEYTIAGLDSFNNCPFIYRKGTLIAVCGKGGDSSSNGNGGAGGGINVAGASGSGRGGGSGGALIAAGTLSSNGIFGSASSLTPISPDTKATGQTGGRALPCPKGNYWLSQGKSPCSDVGTSKIFLANGTLVTNSASITRGFKSGYDIRQTSGQGQNGRNPDPIYNPQTCSRRVDRTGSRRVDRTCYTRVSQTSTRVVPRTSTRRVQQTSYTPVVTITPDPIYVQQTSYTPVVTVTPDPIYVQQTSTRTVAVYDGSCGSLAFFCALGSVASCQIYNNLCPQYVEETYDSSYYIYPASYTTGGDAYDSSYYIYPEPYTTGGDAYDSSYDETYDTSYTETYDSSYDQPYDCSYDENYDDSYDESYDCSYYTYPPAEAAGGNGGAGATGGNGGTDSCGGGGGSGYTDGSVTVISTQLGGSTGFSKIVIRRV
jgi:uncharacterized membrane protein YgcG